MQICRCIYRVPLIHQSLYHSSNILCTFETSKFCTREERKNTMSPSKRDSGYYDGNLEPIAIVGMGKVLPHSTVNNAFPC